MQEKFEFVERKMAEELQLVDGSKVDWKGRSALKFKYGGMKAALLILGKNMNLSLFDDEGDKMKKKSNHLITFIWCRDIWFGELGNILTSSELSAIFQWDNAL